MKPTVTPSTFVPSVAPFGPSAAEREYLDTLNQIELRRLRIRRLDQTKRGLIEEIKTLEVLAQQQQEAAL